MRIAMLVNNLEVSGGYQKLVLRLGIQLKKKGHEVCIYTANVNYNKCYPEIINELIIKSPKQNTHINFAFKFFDVLNKPLRNAKKYVDLAKIIVDDYDVLVLHDDYVLYTLSALEVPDHSKVVWMLNNEMPAGLELLSSRSLCASVGLIRTLKCLLHYPAKWLDWKVVTKGLSKVNVVAAYDERNRREVAGRLRIPVVNVHAGADVGEFEKIGCRRSLMCGRLRILSVGVMFPHRRYEDLIEAVALAHKRGVDANLTIVGRRDLCPEYSAYIVELVSKLGCEQIVEFKDVVSQQDLLKIYGQSDVFSFANDGKTWGIAVFEAIAARIPTIISDNVGAADLLANGRSSWIVPARNSEAIADAIEDISKHPEKALAIADCAAEVLSLVTWDSYTNRMLDLFK
jgi:glycosyltransferase involved in cell wall biosynthesis